MSNIEQKESDAAKQVCLFANAHAMHYTKKECDHSAATLALLWCAFETEAIAQGLTHWRGAELGDV